MKQKKNETKATFITECLNADILDGKFAPGEKLAMDNLKTIYGVGYSPLREALSRLASLGLVTFKEQCGFYVAEKSLSEFYDLYQLRTLIESEGLKRSIALGDDKWEGDVVAAWHRTAKYMHPKNKYKIDMAISAKLHKEFIFSLVKACQSPWLLKIQQLLSEHASRYSMVCIAQHQDVKLRAEYIKDNQLIVDAIIKHDTELALKHFQKRTKKTIKLIANSFIQAKEKK